MQLNPRPGFEFDRRSAAWGAGAFVVFAAPLLVLAGDWLAFVLASTVAGLVVTARSGFYDQTATTGMVAGVVGFACFTPLLFAQQFVAFRVGGMTTGDSALFAAVTLLGQSVIFVPAVVFFGYVTAAISEMVLRRVGVITGRDSTSRR